MRLLLWTYILLTLEVLAFVPLCLLAAVIRDWFLTGWSR